MLRKLFVSKGKVLTTETGRMYSADLEVCGEYVVSQHAIRRLEEGGPNKEVLVEMVHQANAKSRVLDISVADDGLVQTTELAA